MFRKVFFIFKIKYILINYRKYLIRLAYNHNGRKHNWSIEDIKVIYSRDPSKFYVFKLEKWLDKNNKLNAIIAPDKTLQVETNDSTNNQSN